MGFFSWITSDTKVSVRNRFTPEGPTPCKMLAPDGREWLEFGYEGYGIFGGMDFYELLAELNEVEPCPEGEVTGEGMRYAGIKLNFPDGRDNPDPGTIMPKIVSADFKGTYDEVPDSETCPQQGYFDW